MHLVVGCPVRNREEIMPLWFNHLVTSVEHAGHLKDLTVVFVAHKDDPTIAAAMEEARSRNIILHVVDSGESEFSEYRRTWNAFRYEQMARLRNALLGKVRELEPEIFWSLDSDILVGENTYLSAFDMLKGQGYDAVGTKLYMHKSGTRHPSYAMMDSQGLGGLRRSESSGQMPVDVIMASKLMNSQAYSVDYRTHALGEDIGWSLEAARAGCRIGWDGTSISKHVFDMGKIREIDPRCGF